MINYDRVIACLDAILTQAVGNINANSPHLIWWRDAAGNPLTYAAFNTGMINAGGIPPILIPILEPPGPAGDKSASFFYHILLGPAQYKGAGKTYHQMPGRGLFVTSTAADSGTGNGIDTTPGSIVYKLANGSSVTGQQIQDDPARLAEGGRAAALNRHDRTDKTPGVNAMSDARDLMAVHPDDRDRDWLKKSLACAITLEHSTIPPYLCALWSIKQPAHPIRKILQVVVEEEMGHMALASNMLAALGGVPPIGDLGFVPSFPTQLPCKIRPIGNPNLVVGLEGFSVGLVANVFMAIEAPDTKPVPILAVHKLALNAAPVDGGPTYPSIGKFYDAIRAAFEALGTAVTFPIDKQFSYSFSDPLNRVFPIANIADALNAIDQIREQGEGTPTSPAAAMSGKSKELAHYYQFEQIPRKKMFVQDGSGAWIEGPDLLPPPPVTLFRMAPVPEGGYVNPPVAVLAAQKDFNDAYKEMLADLKNAWVLGGGPGKVSLDRAIDRMSGRNGLTGLEDLAKAIFNCPIGTGPAVYGPTFAD